MDEVGNITALGELLDSGTVATRTVAYDGLNRVESLLDGSTTVQGFTYDATGNRLSKTSGGTTANYTYQTGTHRLTNDGTSARTYDAAGHGTVIGTKTFAYDDHGRQVEYSANGVLTRRHLYNAFGARVARWHVLNPANDMVFVYDEAGHIIGEYRTDGTRIREYVWMDDTPIAVLMTAGGSTHQYILTDHLNTPRAVVDPTSNAIIWRWDITTTAFGEHAADGDPDGDGNGYTLNLRYPGQFFDSITGVHYNYFRDYDPGIGRYVQSDPTGFEGGTSTYSYVGASPILYSDRLGLAKDQACVNAAIAAGAVCGGAIGAYGGAAVGAVAGTAVCLPTGPGAPACGVAGAAASSPAGGAIGSAIGGVIGGGIGMATCPEESDTEECYRRFEKEVAACSVWRGRGPKEAPHRWYDACVSRAAHRRNLCLNGNDSEPPAWSEKDLR